MEWIEIDESNLPTREVLAANFKPRTFGYKEKLVGYLTQENGVITCNFEGILLDNCTHYIDLSQFDIGT
jgi:hypothetical protein